MTQKQADDEEQFECCICERLLPLAIEHSRMRFIIPTRSGALGVQKFICWHCREIINENIVK